VYSRNFQQRLVQFSVELVYFSVSQTLLLADPFCFRKITTDPHILAHVNVECPDDSYPKLKIYVSELISHSYKYIPVSYVTMRCMLSL